MFRSVYSLIFLCTVAASQAFAADGVVLNLGGTLSAKAGDGRMRILSVNSDVLSGDTLYTEKDTFARIRFSDGGEITLKPNTQFQVESFSHRSGSPEQDNAVFRLIKGGLRAITGLIGKQDPQRYRMTTSTATIGIRGTVFGVLFCDGDCGGYTTQGGQPLQDGLHVDVTEGAIFVTNQAGTQNLNAGQGAYVQNANTPPVVVPNGFHPAESIIRDASRSNLRGPGTSNGSGDECAVQ
jgi:ferric-dicitrate binding protein FerR (iron transport regulator)